jgi:hypothetical protein
MYIDYVVYIYAHMCGVGRAVTNAQHIQCFFFYTRHVLPLLPPVWRTSSFEEGRGWVADGRTDEERAKPSALGGFLLLLTCRE